MAEEPIALGMVRLPSFVKDRSDREILSEACRPGTLQLGSRRGDGENREMDRLVPFPEQVDRSLEDVAEKWIVQAEPDEHDAAGRHERGQHAAEDWGIGPER